MINATPSLSARSLSRQQTAGIEPFIERYAGTYTFYGSGKVALRDGLAGLVDPGENVLLPAYLPDAVVEPFHELGLEPRYYRVEPSFAPDIADVERRIDADTAAVLSVNYFGFPQPGLEELTALIDEYDCYHVDDNAHAPLSVHDGALLGTNGDIGITSLWKLLPIPNGGVLYLNSDDAVAAYEPSASAGIRERPAVGDGVFVLKSAVSSLLDSAAVRASLAGFLGGGSADTDATPQPETDGRNDEPPAVSTPKERYEEGKIPMFKLSECVLEAVDPDSIRERRRENYRAWARFLTERDDLELVFESLPDGICPQAIPVRAARPDRFVAALEDRGVGAYTWPRLADSVHEDPAYETARYLSERIVALPVHQHVEPSTIETIGCRLLE